MRTSKGIKRREIYKFIKNQINSKGYPPTIREICKSVGLNSTSTVYNHLKALEKSGFIKRNFDSARSIEVIKDPLNDKKLINVPVINNIKDITSISSLRNAKCSFPLPTDFVENYNKLFILKNTDKSMIDINILDGDFFVIEKTNSVENGDIAIVILTTGTTIIRRFFKENGHIRLQPENSSMKSLIVDDCKIIGKLVAHYRAYR